jgi:hypothetical protein
MGTAQSSVGSTSLETKCDNFHSKTRSADAKTLPCYEQHGFYMAIAWMLQLYTTVTRFVRPTDTPLAVTWQGRHGRMGHVWSRGELYDVLKPCRKKHQNFHGLSRVSPWNPWISFRPFRSPTQRTEAGLKLEGKRETYYLSYLHIW